MYTQSATPTTSISSAADSREGVDVAKGVVDHTATVMADLSIVWYVIDLQRTHKIRCGGRYVSLREHSHLPQKIQFKNLDIVDLKLHDPLRIHSFSFCHVALTAVTLI